MGDIPQWLINEMKAGYQAYAANQTLDTNPETEGTRKYMLWAAGWELADRAVAAEMKKVKVGDLA